MHQAPKAIIFIAKLLVQLSPFGGGEGLHRQGVHLIVLHLAAQRGIHALVARNGALALELGRDDGGIPVAPIAFEVM
jgi:hypothetical protein